MKTSITRILGGVAFFGMLSAFSMTAQGELNGTMIESHFFSGIDSIVVGVSQNSSSEVLSDNGFSQLPVAKENFLVTSKDLEDLTLKSIRDTLKSKDVKVEPSSQTVGTYYLGNGKENPNTVFLLLNITYWRGDGFSPKLDHDILAINIKYKRDKDGRSPSGAILLKPREKTLPTFLISVPDDKKKLSQSLTEVLQKVLVDKIVSKVDCAHGIDCGG